MSFFCCVSRSSRGQFPNVRSEEARAVGGAFPRYAILVESGWRKHCQQQPSITHRQFDAKL